MSRTKRDVNQLIELQSRLVVAAALVDADGRVLVAERPQGKHLAGAWEFPGGKVEPGETPEAALIRELHESSASRPSCRAWRRRHSPAMHTSSFTSFCCSTSAAKWRGSPHGHDGQRLRWETVQGLFKLDMLPADRPLLGLLAALI